MRKIVVGPYSLDYLVVTGYIPSLMCGMCVQIKGPVKGLSEIVPTFETVFVLACH